MKAVVEYRDRVRTIFCASCNARVKELPIKQAEALERSEEKVHCKTCAPIVTDIRLSQEAIVEKRKLLAEFVRSETEKVEQEVALISAECELDYSRLAQIKQERIYDTRWAAGNN